MLDVNTTSKNSTHFLRAVELIKGAREEFNVPSENWPHPSSYRFGIPNDNYYAEIWVDGMDWQPSYWIIEEHSLRKPEINPLIIFNQHDERMRFDDSYFEEFINGIIYYRRDYVWVKRDEFGHFTDSTWPFLHLFKDELRHKKMKLYSFEHASQKRIVFWINEDFIPEVYRGRKKKDRISGDSKPKYFCSI